MASNPHSDFTTHNRTLPTLSNLPIFATQNQWRWNLQGQTKGSKRA